MHLEARRYFDEWHGVGRTEMPERTGKGGSIWGVVLFRFATLYTDCLVTVHAGDPVNKSPIQLDSCSK